jgi:arylsulfatase A-like enzyme/tetratricopeptide (TPR) repeat protein
VIVSIDTLRADHLPAYGYRSVDTPHLDELRRDAILYARAYSHCPLTLPSHVSLLTGLLPFSHGVRDNVGYRFDAQAHPALPQLLRSRGYATAGAVSAYVLRGTTGLAQAFDRYDDAFGPRPGALAGTEVERGGGETAGRLLQWIESVGERPLLAFLHLYEPHSPYQPPEPFRSRYTSAYDGEIAAADAIVGDFLAHLRRSGLYDRAIVVLLSDHGEGLNEHGEEFHGVLLYREALHVPLLLKLPASRGAGARVERPVGLVDVLPTVCALTGVAPPPELPGHPLPLDAASPQSAPAALYAETLYPRVHLGWSDLRSLLDERYHFVDGPDPELFDLSRDPGEKTNVLAAEPGVARAMKRALDGLGGGFVPPQPAGREELERLRSLGYLAGDAGSVPAGEALPDPKAHVRQLSAIKAAFELEAQGRDEEAAAALGALLRAQPRLFDVRQQLGELLLRLDRPGEAATVLREGLRLSPGLAPTLAAPLARTCLALRQLAEAESHARLVLSSLPAEGHELLARVALARNDIATAETEARQATGTTTAELNAALILSEIEIRRSRPESALAMLDGVSGRLASEHVPPLRGLSFLRGDALARLGRNAEAAAAFEEEIRRFPRNAPAYARLAIVAALEGRSVADVNGLLERMAAADPRSETFLLAAKTLESIGDHNRAAAWRTRAARSKH